VGGWSARTLKLDANAVGYALDALGPERLVELRVEADVARAHRLLREVNDALDGVRRALLERAPVHELVQVDRVLARHDVLERRARLAAGLALRGLGRRLRRVGGGASRRTVASRERRRAIGSVIEHSDDGRGGPPLGGDLEVEEGDAGNGESVGKLKFRSRDLS
jgi:hypothetical protein